MFVEEGPKAACGTCYTACQGGTTRHATKHSATQSELPGFRKPLTDPSFAFLLVFLGGTCAGTTGITPTLHLSAYLGNMKQLELCLDGRYRLVKPIGRGSFGRVYAGETIADASKDAPHPQDPVRDVAIKLEDYDVDPSILEVEVQAYDDLRREGVPKVYFFGWKNDYRVMVFELLGPNLADLLAYCGGQFSLKTVLLLVDQLLCRLQHIHSKGIIHRDIKPENFLMGRGRSGNIVYITDFGLRGEISQKSLGPIGTTSYASMNGQTGGAQDQWDDLEALGYVLLYFLDGTLPWQRLDASRDEERGARILDMKQKMTPKELCDGHPAAFEEFVRCVRERKTIKPDYRRLRHGFQQLFQTRGYRYNAEFDWTVQLYEELQRTDADSSAITTSQ